MPDLNRSRTRCFIVESWIDALSWPDAVNTIMHWAEHGESKIVAVCNVHSVITARSDTALRDAINNSDMATPDGMPVAWYIGRRCRRPQPRVSGMELALALCAAAESRGVVVSFYGSQPKTLVALRESLTDRFPRLQIGEMISPPFRSLSEEELAADIESLNAARSGIVFVGLGCPKQEIWMHAQRHHIKAVQIGIGAAFDFISGTVKRPPKWMRNTGLEWLGRLLAEPRRLWRRYLITNTLFILWLMRDLSVHNRAGRHKSGI